MTQQLPPGQGPIDPRGAFTPPVSPGGFHAPAAPGAWPGQMPFPQMMPPGMMPPGMMPAGMMPPFSQPPRRGGIFKAILIVLLIAALGISLVMNVVLAGSAFSSTAESKQTTIVQGDSNNQVAVVPVDGLIVDESVGKFDQLLTEVEKDSTIKAMVVEIDTPGGSATASDEMYHRLDRFKKKMHDAGRKFPVVISMRGMATSGGYYIACGGEYLFAEPGTLTGNIGVLFPRFNISKLADKYGIDETTITATTEGRSFKNAGSMFKPSDPSDEKYLQGLVDGIFNQFKAVVQSGRGAKLKDDQKDIFSGKAFIAQDAMDRGLIDKIGYSDEAYAYAASQAGISSAAVVRFSAPSSLLQTLLGESTVPKPAASSQININGVNIDAQAVRDLVSSRPMLLWRGN